jgi:hypothetical protein
MAVAGQRLEIAHLFQCQRHHKPALSPQSENPTYTYVKGLIDLMQPILQTGERHGR